MSSSQKQPLSFEFTKRKRWGDLLISELAEGIILVLSPACKVLYCGPAVTELLGWKDADLVDCNFLSLIYDEDQSLFTTCFDESIRTNVDLLVHSRLKTNSQVPKPILFEIKGRPHFLNAECVCFFASARPYHSRNTVTLNTMLDLKIENERLQQRLRDLKSMLRNSSMSQPYLSSVQLGQTRMQGSSSLVGATGTQGNYYPDTQSLRNPLDNSYGSSLLPADEDNIEDGSKRKKAKKNASEQYVCVTCGRTDSPEWRKGPLGPKTLCNACGLRWAKQMRKTDEPTDHDAHLG